MAFELTKSVTTDFHYNRPNFVHRANIHVEVVGGTGSWDIGMLWNIVSDVYTFTKGKKSINAEKNENVELNSHTSILW